MTSNGTPIGRYFIGRVKRAPRPGDPNPFASVEPLIEADATGGLWVGPVLDPVRQFPQRGLIHWYRAPQNLVEGSLWQLVVEEHPYAEQDGRPEFFQLADLPEPIEPIEVLDLRSWRDEALIRRVITGRGIPMSPAPIARRLLLWLTDDVYVGPLFLKAGALPGLFALDVPEGSNDASRMPTWRLTPDDVSLVRLQGERWFVSPGRDLHRRHGFQNWMSDVQVARSILGRLRKMNPQLSNAIGVTDRVFKEYLDLVERGQFGQADAAVERARAGRLNVICETIRKEEELLALAAESLLSTQEIRNEVEKRVQLQVAADLAARQATIAIELADANTALAEVRSLVKASSAQADELTFAISEKQRELDAKVSSFDEAVTTRLDEIARRPEILFTENAVIRGLIGRYNFTTSTRALPSARGDGSEVSSATTRSDDWESSRGLADDVQIRTSLSKHALAGALSPRAMFALHAVFITGSVPVVAGSQGYDLLRAYSNALAGGRLHWLPVSGAFVDPQDILGRYSEPSGRIVASPSGILDVLREANHSGRLHMVVFDGFNRAAAEGYLTPILEAALAARIGDNSRAIPLANPDELADTDPYLQFAKLRWPPNVLVACLPADGTATLPVPTSVWRYLALLDSDDGDGVIPASATLFSRDEEVTEVSPLHWKESLAASGGKHAAASNEARGLASALGLTARDAIAADRLRNALTAQEVPEADATDIAFAAALIARSGAAASTVDAAIIGSGIRLPSWRKVFSIAQGLRL